VVDAGVMVGPAAVRVDGGLAADHHPSHRPITSQPPTRLRGQRPRPPHLPTQTTRAAQQAVQIHGDEQLGPHPTRLGQPPTLQAATGQLRQGIGGPLAPLAVVVGRSGAGQRLQGRQHGGPGLGLQQPPTATMRSTVGDTHNPRRS
jgi:DNA-binding transcriptional MocR family regulator